MLQKKSPVLKRNTPTQARSRATVASILGGAARVLIREDYESATTNRIAEAAGVSIGSVYQYFASKEAIVLAVVDRHFAEVQALAPARLRAARSMRLRGAVRELVALLVDAHAVDPGLHEALTQRVPRKLLRERALRVDRLFAEMILAFLESHRDEIARTDIPLAAFVVGHTLEALTHGAVVHHPDRLHDGALAVEMTDLVVRYLTATPRRPRARAG
jgi:AcrR family transcriptional regulator